MSIKEENFFEKISIFKIGLLLKKNRHFIPFGQSSSHGLKKRAFISVTWHESKYFIPLGYVLQAWNNMFFGSRKKKQMVLSFWVFWKIVNFSNFTITEKNWAFYVFWTIGVTCGQKKYFPFSEMTWIQEPYTFWGTVLSLDKMLWGSRNERKMVRSFWELWKIFKFFKFEYYWRKICILDVLNSGVVMDLKKVYLLRWKDINFSTSYILGSSYKSKKHFLM